MISETQLTARIIDSPTGIDKRIGGIPEFPTDTTTSADSRGNPTDLEVKVLVIIVGSTVDAEGINLIIDSIITAVDKVVLGTVLLGDRIVKTVHEQMSRFGGLSEERPSVFKTSSKLGTHLSTQCSGDERQSRPYPARYMKTIPVLWKNDTLPLESIR
ncbi:hypothetical protein TNCV_4633271 [Trichonephila clavipes]|nr:hypothetical protein TNCV_4633271 [Trichonephila clavipes]